MVELVSAHVEFVLDASALLALLHGEPGADVVQLVLDRSAMSAANWAEVCQRAITRNADTTELREGVEALGLELVSLSPDDAERAAALWTKTHGIGLSLGDRACLALAARLGVPALTADRAWNTINVGVEVQVIR